MAFLWKYLQIQTCLNLSTSRGGLKKYNLTSLWITKKGLQEPAQSKVEYTGYIIVYCVLLNNLRAAPTAEHHTQQMIGSVSDRNCTESCECSWLTYHLEQWSNKNLSQQIFTAIEADCYGAALCHSLTHKCCKRTDKW